MAKRTPTPPRQPSKRTVDLLRGVSAALSPSAGVAPAKALYVMLTDEQKRRYDAAAQAAGMTMREYVVNALEAQVAQQSSTAAAAVKSLGLDENREGNVVAALQMFAGYGIRLGRMERALEALQGRVDREWGPEGEPFKANGDEDF